MKSQYSIVEEDGYVKVKHTGHGTVCAGVKGADGKVKNIEFTNPDFQRINAIRQPAMRILQEWERKISPFTCPDCGGDCETLLAALKTSLAGGAR